MATSPKDRRPSDRRDRGRNRAFETGRSEQGRVDPEPAKRSRRAELVARDHYLRRRGPFIRLETGARSLTPRDVPAPIRRPSERHLGFGQGRTTAHWGIVRLPVFARAVRKSPKPAHRLVVPSRRVLRARRCPGRFDGSFTRNRPSEWQFRECFGAQRRGHHGHETLRRRIDQVTRQPRGVVLRVELHSVSIGQYPRESLDGPSLDARERALAALAVEHRAEGREVQTESLAHRCRGGVRWSNTARSRSVRSGVRRDLGA
jgi:hypothetical protein